MPLWALSPIEIATLTRGCGVRYGHVTIIWMGRPMPRQKLRSQKSSISIRKTDPTHDSVVVSAAELAEVVGIEPETVNNWLRRGIISRASLGGRQLRTRLFSTDEVFKAALTNELVQLGIAPSPSSDAVSDLWKVWQRTEARNGRNVYAAIFPNNGKISVVLCFQDRSGAPLQLLSSGAGYSEFNLPRGAFAVVPVSIVVDHVSTRLTQLVNDDKTNSQ
jgi:hypothetical protein